MDSDKVDLYNLIDRGGVYQNIGGTTVQEVYSEICSRASFPSGVDPKTVESELLEREKLLSTAVGEGIAIPHTRKSVVTDENDQCILVCYLDNEINMNAPDARNVNLMFVLLSNSNSSHLKILSSLAKMIHIPDVKEALDKKVKKEELLEIIGKNI